jgi:hypothetical protein
LITPPADFVSTRMPPSFAPSTTMSFGHFSAARATPS